MNRSGLRSAFGIVLFPEVSHEHILIANASVGSIALLCLLNCFYSHFRLLSILIYALEQVMRWLSFNGAESNYQKLSIVQESGVQTSTGEEYSDVVLRSLGICTFLVPALQ